jgi:hypothetical protein
MNRFFQALIALSGLVITGLLGYQTATNTERQTNLADAENKYTLIALFSDQFYAALDRCDPDLMRIAVDAANELSEVHGEDQYLEYTATSGSKLEACNVTPIEDQPDSTDQPNQGPGPGIPSVPPNISTQPSPAPAPAPAPRQQPSPEAPPQQQQQQQAVVDINPARNLELRQEEGYLKKGAVRGGQAASEGRWYAVLASYKPGEEESYAVADVQKFRKVIAESKTPGLDVQVFRTSLSDHYAIVLASADGSRESARDLAATARSLGLSNDSFVQDDRNWTRCDQTDSVAGLSACARVMPPSKR